MKRTWIISIILSVVIACQAYADINSDFLAAVEKGDKTAVINLLKERADVNARNQEGQTALMKAAEAGYLEIVKILLDKGADINAKEEEYHTDWTALMFAAFKGHLDIVKVLLNAGADVNIKEYGYKETALRLAANRGYTAIVKVLLDSGADENLKDKTSWMALMTAASNGHTDTMQALLDRGANVNAKDENGETALMWAAQEGHTETVKALLDGDADVNTKNNYGNTALMMAAKEGHTETVKALLDKGADVSVIDGYGETLLTEAINEGHTEIAALLKQHGAIAYPAYADINSNFLAAVKYGDKTAVINFLKEGADVNARDQEGQTALILATLEATINGETEIVRILLDNGADVNVENEYGATAMYIADNRFCYQEIVELLIKAGAVRDINARLVHAAKKGDAAIVQTMLDKGADVNTQICEPAGWTALMVAAEAGHLDIVKILLDKEVDLNAKGGVHEGWTALMFAASNDHLDIVEVLLNAGADVNIKEDGYKETALWLAAKNGYTAIVKALLEKGADVNAEQGGYGTILDAARPRGDEIVPIRSDEIVQILLDYGADADVKKKNGVTASIEAAATDHTNNVEASSPFGKQTALWKNEDGQPKEYTPDGEPGKTWHDPLTGMEFVWIPAGSFMMGSPADESGRKINEKQHRVTLTRGFYLQTTEVTQGQWKAVMGEENNPSIFRNCGDNCPVEHVSWDDTQDFIRELNRREGNGEYEYRLPTEAEWEYACRAGSEGKYCFGDDTSRLGEYAWYSDNSESKMHPVGQHPVGQKERNKWGLYDMHGNVWEWCRDWYGKYPSGSLTDPKGPPSGEYRILRGGSWTNAQGLARCAYRYSYPFARNYSIGFRCLRTKK